MGGDAAERLRSETLTKSAKVWQQAVSRALEANEAANSKQEEAERLRAKMEAREALVQAIRECRPGSQIQVDMADDELWGRTAELHSAIGVAEAAATFVLLVHVIQYTIGSGCAYSNTSQCSDAYVLGVAGHSACVLRYSACACASPCTVKSNVCVSS